jgi:WD40 repeat protein/predicted Ser/Thr protein kinase
VSNTDWLRQLNVWCDDFEAEWRSSSAPRIEQFLERAVPEKRRELLSELLGLELAYRKRRGDELRAAEYLVRFLNDAEVVRGVFEADRAGKARPAADARNGNIGGPHPDPLREGEGTIVYVADAANCEAGSTGEPADAERTLPESRLRRARISVLPVNTRVGHFELLEEIGRGGMGVVYKARQVNLGRTVALKMILSGEFADPHEVERFRAEAEAAARLQHPNIVPLYEVGEEDSRHFFAMALIEGPDLHEVLRDGPLPPREAARLIQRVAEAVHYAHSQGIIHRDLKPGNILLDGQGEPHITDFGLARRRDANSRLTETGQIVGTVGFIPPEQARERVDEIGPASDVYTLGALLYKCLTGRPPFQAADPIEALRQAVDNDPVPPRLLSPGVPRDLETLCLKCLEKEPRRRFASAQALADELARYLRGEPIRSRPIGLLPRAWRCCRRRPAAAGLAAVSLAATVMILAGLILHNGQLEGINQQLLKKTDDALQSERAAQRQEQVARIQQARAEASEEITKDSLYAADISRAANAARAGDPRAVSESLNRWVPKNGERDRRGFEWWFLSREGRLAPRRLLAVDGAVYTLCYSPDQNVLAVAGQDAVVRLFEPSTGKIVREIKTGQVEVNGVAFSPSGTELATAGDDGTVRLWDLSTAAQLWTCKPHPNKAFQLVFMRDGTSVLSCGDDPVIRVLDARGGEIVSALNGHRGDLQSIVLSADGKTLASIGSDELARLWDVASKTELIARTTGRGGECVLFNDDCSLFFFGTGDGRIEAMNVLMKDGIVHDARLASRISSLDRVRSLALHPTGRWLASGDASGAVHIWDAPSGQLYPSARQSWLAHQGNVHALLWSPDGSQLISAGGDGNVMSWQLSDALGDAPGISRVDPAATFTLIPGTTLMATAARTPYQGEPPHTLVMWNWRTGIHTAVIDYLDYHDVAASPDGTYFAALRRHGDVVTYPIPKHGAYGTGKLYIECWESGKWLERVRISPDSRTIAAVFRDAVDRRHPDPAGVYLLAAQTLQIERKIEFAGARRVAFSPAGGQIAISTETNIALYDLAEAKLMWSKPQTMIEQLDFTPDGAAVACAGLDRVVTLRRSSDGGIARRLAAHRSPIRSFAFSPDGKTLATGGASGVIKLWHVPTMQELFDLRGPGGACARLEFSNDSRNLVCLIHPDPVVHDRVLIYSAPEPQTAR